MLTAPNQPDPKLIQAREEIKAILVKYDIMGFLLLQSQRHGEFLDHINPSWSCMFFEELEGGAAGIRFRSKLVNYPSKEAQKESVECTTGALFAYRDHIADRYVMVENLIEMLGKHFDIEHITKKV